MKEIKVYSVKEKRERKVSSQLSDHKSTVEIILIKNDNLQFKLFDLQLTFKIKNNKNCM
jgi:hypothetical protein